MKILITNDDGIRSEVLLPLAKWLGRFGEVTIIAPKYEQSAKSHAIEIHKSFEVMKTDLFPGIEAYTVDSTPADCVRFAVIGLKQTYDFVISGINRGLNIGRDISYSGTVAAVFEAASLGIPAAAISTDPKTFDAALASLDRVHDFVTRHDLFGKNKIYNINIPLEAKKILITRQGGPYYADDFIDQGNNLFRPIGKSIFTDSSNDELDTDAVMHGNISIMPLTLDRTNQTVFRELSKLNEEG